MWIERDFNPVLAAATALPIKVLKGPRQVGKTSFLERLGSYEVIYLDDAALRISAEEHPREFLDALPKRIVLDEAGLAPSLFPELKRRVDQQRRNRKSEEAIDIWITGSNQTLLQKNVRESLAGRASYFDFNTLSIHELGDLYSLPSSLLRGGWPELYVSTELSAARYLNDLIATFIEKDIISAAGIERKAAFTKSLQLIANRIGQLFNASDVASSASVDVTTIQSWAAILETNGILRRLSPFHTNLNKRLIKSPKFYFEDVALASRLQGWTDYESLSAGSGFGSLIENLAISEFSRFFFNRGDSPKFNFVRSKEKVEIDLLVHLPNQRAIAVEIKSSTQDFTGAQMRLLDELGLEIVERWIVCPEISKDTPHARAVSFSRIWSELERLY